MKPLDPRLLRYSRSSRGFLLSTVFISVASALLTVLQAFLLAHIVVAIFQRHQEIRLLDTKIIGLLILLILRSILNIFSDWMSSLSSSKIRNELRSSVLRKSLKDGSDIANEVGSAQLSILLSSGIASLDGYFAKFLPQLFTATIVPISVSLIIGLNDWQTGLIVVFTIPLIPIFGILIGRYTAAATAKKWQALGTLSGYFLDLLSGLTTLKVYGRAKLQEARMRKVGEDYRKETMKVLRISFLSSLALELIATLSVALIAVSIGLRLVGGSLQLETALVVLILAPEVYWPIRQVATYFHAAADGVQVFNELYSILERPSSSGNQKANAILAISWSDLTISFKGRPDVHLPAGQVASGELHAIIGPSGSGKSTLLKVLMGFLTPTSGEVLITTEVGVLPISDIDAHSLRNLIAWMPQEPKFPASSIKQVLLDAKPYAQENELVETLKSVDLSLHDLRNGLHTQLGTLTEPLSIGQLRKIALARALLKESSIIMVDEPTASVDDVSEEAIHKVLKLQAQRGKIVIVVSHRPLLLLQAEKSLVL